MPAPRCPKRYAGHTECFGYNGSELLAKALQKDLAKRGIKLANIEPGKTWQNGNNESFNGIFRKACLNAETFASPMEARVVIEQWRRRYNGAGSAQLTGQPNASNGIFWTKGNAEGLTYQRPEIGGIPDGKPS